MSEIILLGAGASVEAGVPAAYKMTEVMLQHFNYSPFEPQHIRIAYVVIGGLLFQKGINGDNPLNKALDIEEFINTIRLLGERNTLEIAPFVGYWHPVIEEFDRFTPSYVSRNQFINTLTECFRGSRRPNSSVLQRDFQKAIAQNQPQPGGGIIFREMLWLIYSTLKNMVLIDSYKLVTYLMPLINLTKIRKRLTIATLNYDNTLELAASYLGVQYSTGIDSWIKTGIINTDRDCLHILKIHGSIDWTPKKLNRGQDESPIILFGQRNKLTTEGPFLDLLMAFRNELMKASKLIVIGYSFRDDHVNNYILHWLMNNAENTITVIDPAFKDIETKFIVNLREMLKNDRLQVISKPTSEGLIDLYGSIDSNFN